jgi:hypothetical protein
VDAAMMGLQSCVMFFNHALLRSYLQLKRRRGYSRSPVRPISDVATRDMAPHPTTKKVSTEAGPIR